MRDDTNEPDLIEKLERMDRFFEGTEAGQVPLEVLRSRGIEMPEEQALDDAELHRVLWMVIHAMAELEMFVEYTDHLSDRELYRYLAEVLREETILGTGAEILSPIGGCSEEDNENYLRYYADEEDRKGWGGGDVVVIPPHEALPYDRDRLLPQNALGEEDGEEPS